MAYYVHKDSYRSAIAGHIAALQRDLFTTATLPPKENLDVSR